MSAVRSDIDMWLSLSHVSKHRNRVRLRPRNENYCFHLSIVCRDRTHVGCVTHDTARITNQGMHTYAQR